MESQIRENPQGNTAAGTLPKKKVTKRENVGQEIPKKLSLNVYTLLHSLITTLVTSHLLNSELFQEISRIMPEAEIKIKQ